MVQITIEKDTATFADDVLRGKIQTDYNGVTSLNSPNNFVYNFIYNYGDTIFGLAGNDTMIGDRYDTVAQNYGYDNLYGGDGNDTIYQDTGPEDPQWFNRTGGGQGKNVGGLGNDTIFGGSGLSGDYIYGDVDNSGEGSAGDGNDILHGRGGNDWIYGGGGDDWIDGGDDSDGNLRGGNGNDTIRGGLGDDNLYGGFGSDLFYGDAGGDSINGDGSSPDNGFDTLTYIEIMDSYVVVDLSITSGQETNAGGYDTIRNIESLIGTNQGDRLKGSDAREWINGAGGADQIKGGLGWDQLYGGAGNDNIFGGRGKDTLDGGSGKDKFYFLEVLTTANRDKIVNFKAADDTFMLSKSKFAKVGAAVSSAEFYKGSSAHDSSDRIIYNKTTGALMYDADGNTSGGVGAKVFAVVGKNLNLTYHDFDVV